MNLSSDRPYRARAAHCLHQSNLTKDAILKKYWDDLADEWMALDSSIVVKRPVKAAA
jgi:hypothetical protein